MPLFSRNTNSRSNPAQSNAGSQHLIQPQNTYKGFKSSVTRLFRRSHHGTQMPAIDITTLGIGQAILVGHEQHAFVDNANDAPRAPATSHHDSLNMQAEGRNALSGISEPGTIPVATQFQGAQGFNISGQPRFTNIGGIGNTVNNYGGAHGLENLKDFVSFAALHDSAEQDPTRRCHPGTRKIVLGQLRHWSDSPDATQRICWLHGPAGAGKSAIAQTIAHGYQDGEVVATFFFYRSDPSRNDGNRLFPTIAWQLAFSIPTIKDFIVHVLDRIPHLPRKDVETQFKQLVAYPFQPTNNVTSQMLQPAPVVIVDGLDECSDEHLQRRILNVIGNAVKDRLVPLRFLVCSRPEALIEEVLDQFKDITLRIDLATLDDSNRDVEKYLLDQFSDIRSKRGLATTWPGPEIIEELVYKSSGNFILAATVMRYIGDEDCDPEEQLDIIRNLKPRGDMSPFALLDELYLEILQRQRDQAFLKTFLALLVGRSSIQSDDLHEDDATLMNVSEKKKLHVKLRRMRSLLKFEPFIDVHHKSFLDFLQDPSRSGQYHVSEQGGRKRYLELIVDCVVRHVSMAIEQPDDHEKCCSSPKFRSIVINYPPKIVLLVEDWQETLKPLLGLQDKLLNTSKPRPCCITQVMRELLLHLVILQGNHHITSPQVLESNVNETVTEHSPTLVTEAGQGIPANDLDRCLSVLLSHLQEPNSVLMVDAVIIERMSSLLVFDSAEIGARVRSVTDAHRLIYIIDLLIHNKTFLSHCGPDAACKTALLASEIYSRVPLLPRSVFLNRPTQCGWVAKYSISDLEVACQSTFITRILDQTFINSLLWIYQGDEFKYDNVSEQDESVDKWLERSSPNFVTRIRVMLEIGRAIRYIHSMDVVTGLSSGVIKSEYISLDSNLRAKVLFYGYFAWQIREDFIIEEDFMKYTPESNISAFAELFQKVCFGGGNKDLPWRLVEDSEKLITRCGAKDPKSRPAMEEVVKTMETWNLT